MGERGQVAGRPALDVGTSADQQSDAVAVLVLDSGMEWVPVPAFPIDVRPGIKKTADRLHVSVEGSLREFIAHGHVRLTTWRSAAALRPTEGREGAVRCNALVR